MREENRERDAVFDEKLRNLDVMRDPQHPLPRPPPTHSGVVANASAGAGADADADADTNAGSGGGDGGDGGDGGEGGDVGLGAVAGDDDEEAALPPGVDRGAIVALRSLHAAHTALDKICCLMRVVECVASTLEVDGASADQLVSAQQLATCQLQALQTF